MIGIVEAPRTGRDGGCTTILVAGDATKDGSIILGKNRDLGEWDVQWLYHQSRMRHPPNSTVRLQYIEIPQVEETYAWIGFKTNIQRWGVGMGINEWGVVVVDNDALTREPAIRSISQSPGAPRGPEGGRSDRRGEGEGVDASHPHSLSHHRRCGCLPLGEEAANPLNL